MVPITSLTSTSTHLHSPRLSFVKQDFASGPWLSALPQMLFCLIFPLLVSSVCPNLSQELWSSLLKVMHKPQSHHHFKSLPSFTFSFCWWLSGKESACQCRRHRRCKFDPCVRKIPWRRDWQPTPVFLLGKFHGQKSLAGYSPWGCRVRHDLATKTFVLITAA